MTTDVESFSKTALEADEADSCNYNMGKLWGAAKTLKYAVN